MNIIIINLAAATGRLSFQTKQMARLGLAFERLEAISAADLTDEIDKPIWKSWQRPMRAGEIGCFLSHRAAWQKIAESGQPALVLEDDALLSSFVPEVLGALAAWDRADHVSLEVKGRRKLVGRAAITVAGRVGAVRMYQDRSGAAAYVLWPSGAERLLAKTRHRAGIADAILCESYDLRSYQLEPACAIQLDQCAAYGLPPIIATDSSTAPNRTPRPDPGSALHAAGFRWRRIKAQLGMAIRRLSVIHRAEKRLVTLDRSHFDWARETFGRPQEEA